MVLVRLIVAACLFVALSPLVWGDAMERMKLEKLKATHERVEALQSQVHKVSLPSGYDDVRALLHVHSAFSHDSRGTIEEILGAAKKVGVRVIMFTEHPASHYDYTIDGHQGMKDGILLIPGAETGGYLAYPKTSIKDKQTSGNQEFADLVRSTGGMIFLCHLEERMNWDIDKITGNEIYNTHADFKEETKFINALRNPLTMFSLSSAVKEYPQEMFAALQDYPADYLKRWDELCQKSHHTGVSANDAHHNQAYRAKLTDTGKVVLEDALGKKLAVVDPQKVLPLKPLAEGKTAGDIIWELDLDPYERSFHHVSTHLLMHEVTQEAVWEALQAGRCYVAFDWIADPTGFVFRADRAGDTWPMGSDVPGPEGVHLRAEAPLEATIKLIRNGELVSEHTASSIDVPIDKPGNYRVEVWVTMVGEARPWILSNPIYVREK